MSATETNESTALLTGASAGIGAIHAAAKVASPLAARAENALVSGPILPALLRLTLPNLAAMLVVALVAIFETVYVGILGTTPLAAIALVFPLIMLMQMLSAGAMGGGVSSAISRALGAGDLERAEALALHAVVIGAAAGLSFSAIFVAFGAPILRMLGGSGAVLGEALVYANIALAGAILTWLVNTFASVLRGTGNMRVPSLTLLAASGLQIVLGGGLGLGIGPIPRFGLAGVATGLIVAYALAALFLFWFLRSGRGRLRLKFGAAALQREMFFDILKVGAVSSLGSFQVVLTVLILTRLVAGFGTEALAGYGIGARLEFLLIPIVFAVGVASVPMVGMAMGARDIARARRVAWTAAGVAAAMLGAIGLVVTIAPDLWSGRFHQRPRRPRHSQPVPALGRPRVLVRRSGAQPLLCLARLRQGACPGSRRDRPALGDRSRRLVADGERCAGVEPVRARGRFHDGLRLVHRRCRLPDAVGYPRSGTSTHSRRHAS